MRPLKVWARWRPLNFNESEEEIDRIYSQDKPSGSTISINASPRSTSLSHRTRSWRSESSFSGIFEGNDKNSTVFDSIIAPELPRVLQGECCNVFAYGHSGSGKSHTIIGYDYENIEEIGLCLAAARRLVDAFEGLNNAAKADDNKLGLGIRMFELRKNTAFDLLNNGRECFVRQGHDGRVHIRGETEMLENGKVRVRPIMTKACWKFEDVCRELLIGLKRRATGTSTVHDQSSRTHAVLEMEIVTQSLLKARDAIVERESELVPVGKHATDIYIEEHRRGYIQNEEGKYVVNPDYQINHQQIEAAEVRKAKFELNVMKAEDKEHEIFQAIALQYPCIGGKFVFVDLAGSEYHSDQKIATKMKQTAQEKEEGRQINTDLLALKEVIRARALKKSHIPFRSSPLTMVLRQHFQGSADSHSAMILTVSPSVEQFAATMNTLKYGNLTQQ